MPLYRSASHLAGLGATIAALVLTACSPGGGGSTPPPPPDTSAPTAPTGLTATPTSATSAALAWSAATDGVGVTGYEVLRDGAVVISTAGTAAADGSLVPSTAYCWTVRAFDAAGNRSPASSPACASTPAPPDIVSPTVVETTPPAGATGVAPGVVFTSRFDEAVAPASLAAGFTLEDADGAAVAATVAWDASTLTATLSPSAPLLYLGRYTATVGTSVTDLAGNHLAAASRWTVRVEPKPLVLQRAAGGAFGAPCAATAIAMADLDRDGHDDVAFACGESHVWIALGDGAGGFGPATGLSIGPRTGYGFTFVHGVAATDLDGDGYPDLAVTEAPCDLGGSCLLNGFVDVLLNAGAAAPGSFGAPVPLTAGMLPTPVVAVDLDGDGAVDLASGDRWSGRVSVFLATGNGSFASAAAYATAGDPMALVAVPVRPGGPLDLVPVGGPVLLGDGAGAFAPSAAAFTPGPYPRDVAAADLDGDGLMDLVIANDGGDFVTLLFGDGTGGFPRATTVTTGRYPEAVAVSDLNGDGWPDLVVVLYQNGGVGTNTTVVLLGVGDGEFAPPLDLYAQPIVVSDIDGDGRPDLLGARLQQNPFGFVIDAWLNATP